MMQSIAKYIGWTAAALLLSFGAHASAQKNRLVKTEDFQSRTALEGTVSPLTRVLPDKGRMPASQRLAGISLVFSLSDAQKADLETLLAEQQNPASPNYHKWLTPAEYKSRFSISDSDLAQVEQWLQQQGFTIDSVANSRNSIAFSGTVAQVEAAFGTQMHYYQASTGTEFAPSAELSIPSAIAPVVRGITNLSTFRPKSHLRARPNFTSSQTDAHYMTPGDVATIYDVKSAYNAGYTGAGQSIAVVGQSAVYLSDIENFQNAIGMQAKSPQLVLVPSSGTSTHYQGDEAESDLDLEYSGAIAKGATIYFVYVGGNKTYSVWDSINYAVDTRIAPIISTSYGSCEAELSTNGYSVLNAIMQQAAVQGQTVVAASGDDGSTDCYEFDDLSNSQRQALAVDYPASSQYVLGVGGTEFTDAAVASSSSYWAAAGGNDIVSSALSYMPEQVWNDNSTSGLSAGGGGTSTLTSRPGWQTGVTGIAAGSYRLVPDISLDASPNNAGYLYCSSDSSTNVAGSCSNGFRDQNNQYLTLAGGTSFAAPIFAGMLAILNQAQNSTGQGAINSTLYGLASNVTTYASAFHDITSGSNACNVSSLCTSAGASGYTATAGYDQATGLGSIDLYNLMMVWPASATAALVSSSVNLTVPTTTPQAGASDTVTIAVASGSSGSSVTPTGTLTVVVDGTTANSSLALSNGTASYTFSSNASGSHVIAVTYSGDAVYAGSTASLVLTVGAYTGSGTGSFTLAAPGMTVSQGGSATTTITATPAGGYKGTISFDNGVSTDNSYLVNNACYDLNDITITDTTAQTTTFTLYTDPGTCNASTNKRQHFKAGANLKKVQAEERTQDLRRAGTTVLSMAGLLLIGFIGRRSRLWQGMMAVLLLLVVAGGLSACGGSSSSINNGTGTSTITIEGTDTTNGNIASSVTFTVTIK